MAIIDVELDALLSLVGKDMSVEELENVLFEMGMELDHHDNCIVGVDITMDRPDMLSLWGLADALRKYLGLAKPQWPQPRPSGVVINVDNSVKEVRPYIAAFVAKDLSIDEPTLKTMIYMQEKLHATFCRNRVIASIGIYPIREIKPPLRYLAVSPDQISFVPLGMSQKMNGYEILKQHETGVKYAFILENHSRFPLFIDSEGNTLSMPPIINSERTGRVEVGTTEVLVEVTGINLRRVSQLINILAHAFEVMDATLESVEVRYPDARRIYPDMKERKMRVTIQDIKNLIGISLDAKTAVKCLERMDYKASIIDEKTIEAVVPYYRTDILHKVDVIDDIARAYGFNNMEPEMPNIFTLGKTMKKTKILNFLREAITGLGYIEVFTTALSNEDTLYRKMNMNPPKNMIKVLHAKSEIMNTMRDWLLPCLVESIAMHATYQLPIKIFEINDVCVRDETSDTHYRNDTRLGMVHYSTRVTFTDVKRFLDFIMRILEMNYTLERYDHPSFVPGRTARIIVRDGKKKVEVGFLGEIHPRVITNWGLVHPMVGLELSLSRILSIKEEK